MFTGDFQLSSPQIMPSGGQVTRHTARFKSWQGPDVEDTWNGKATLDFNGEPQWGEFAVLLSLTDGWNGYAVEVYNGLRFWKTSPFHPPDRRLTLQPPERFREFLMSVAKANSHSQRPNYSGCWDLLAWKGNEFRFIEVKRWRKDYLRPTQYKWFESARSAGIPISSFVIVEWVIIPDPHPQFSTGKNPIVSVDHRNNLLNGKEHKSSTTKSINMKVTIGKWNEASFYKDLELRSTPSTVALVREIYNWSMVNANELKWGNGEELGSFRPWFKYRMLKYNFFNVDSKGYLWMSLSKHRFFQNEFYRKDLLSMLSNMPVLKVEPSVAIMQAWFVINLNAINTEELKEKVLFLIKWVHNKIQLS